MALTNLKRIALYRVRRTRVDGDEIIDFLKSWWSEKYKRPVNDPLLLSRYVEELMVEYYEDLFRAQPDKLSEFEISINDIAETSDENWFKKVMGDQYTPENSFSNEFKQKSTAAQKEQEGFDDVYHTLGAKVSDGKQNNKD